MRAALIAVLATIMVGCSEGPDRASDVAHELLHCFCVGPTGHTQADNPTCKSGRKWQTVRLEWITDPVKISAKLDLYEKKNPRKPRPRALAWRSGSNCKIYAELP